VIGAGAGAVGDIDIRLLMRKLARIHGSALRARPLEQKAATARAMECSVLPLFQAGTVSVPVAKTYPLAEAAAAYKHFRGGGKFGKIVLVTDG
jgi:NADPH:quinone reductase-like Zn-dependent oxidoreductase